MHTIGLLSSASGHHVSSRGDRTQSRNFAQKDCVLQFVILYNDARASNSVRRRRINGWMVVLMMHHTCLKSCIWCHSEFVALLGPVRCTAAAPQGALCYSWERGTRFAIWIVSPKIPPESHPPLRIRFFDAFSSSGITHDNRRLTQNDFYANSVEGRQGGHT